MLTTFVYHMNDDACRKLTAFPVNIARHEQNIKQTGIRKRINGTVKNGFVIPQGTTFTSMTLLVWALLT